MIGALISLIIALPFVTIGTYKIYLSYKDEKTNGVRFTWSKF